MSKLTNRAILNGRTVPCYRKASLHTLKRQQDILIWGSLLFLRFVILSPARHLADVFCRPIQYHNTNNYIKIHIHMFVICMNLWGVAVHDLDSHPDHKKWPDHSPIFLLRVVYVWFRFIREIFLFIILFFHVTYKHKITY